ncbi:MAG: hypothetical protein ACRDG3_00370 [Tepidiformaceae bacterium]
MSFTSRPLWLGLALTGIAAAAVFYMLGPTSFADGANSPHVAGIASDGLVKPPTVTPTPEPPPPPLVPQCYGPRRDDAPTLRPADTDSVFSNCQVVAYYGYPPVPGLGVLGQFDTDAEMVTALEAEAANFDAANGPRDVAPAIHLIAAIAQASPGADGDYLLRAPASVINAVIALAEKDDLLVILDLQLGHASIDDEFAAVEPYLLNPRVHLALDPEWVTPGAPGTTVGSLDASTITHVQELLGTLVVTHHLPRKMLIVHRFTEGMITNAQDLGTLEGVDLVIDIDGFGYAAAKTSEYNAFVRDAGMPHGGMKLFYHQDVDLMTPAQVDALDPQPDVVIFQ